MDYVLAFQIGAIISAVILFFTLARFSYSLRRLRGKVSMATFRALMFLGGATLSLGMIIVTTAFVSGTVIQRPWLLMFFAFLIFSQVQVATNMQLLHRLSYIIVILAIIDALFISITSPLTISPHLLTLMVGGFILSLSLSIYLLKQSITIYSVSVFLLQVLFLLSWYVISNELITNLVTEPFLLIFMPTVIASAMLGSLLRPWRQIVYLCVLFFALIACPSIGIAALLSSPHYEIAVFAFGALFVALCALLSLDYFLREAIETGTHIPRYMSVCLIVAALLASSHTVAFSIVISTGEVAWNLSFVEWLVGLIGIAAFILCGHYAILSRSVFSAMRRVLICIVAVLFILGNAYVQDARWNFIDLVPSAAALILFGVAGYIKFAQRLQREGAARTARRFITFANMPLLFAISMMLTENLPFIIPMTLTVACGILLIVSSPVRLARISASSSRATTVGITTTSVSSGG